MSRNRRSKGPQLPVIGLTEGPDRKGRFFVPLPQGDKSLFFYGGVPGERVQVRRGKRGRRGEQGDLLQVLEPAVARREPPCRHFGVCGGCTLQNLPEAAALDLKTAPHYQMLAQQFPQAELRSAVASPLPFAYRTKVELTFLRDRSGQTTLGFHRRGRFDRGVDVGRCWLSPLPASLLMELRAWFSEFGLRGWHPRDNDGDLRYLLYRHASRGDDDLAALVVNSSLHLSSAARERLIEVFQGSGVRGALLIRQSSVAGAVVADSVEPLYGPQTLVDRVGPLVFELSWKSFFQVNPRSYELLLEAMRDWRQTRVGGKIIDLFCGVGSIGLCIYQQGDQLLGVELLEEAVEDARCNAERNQIPARFEQRSAEDWTDFATDLLILDPPRSGCHPKLLRLLEEKAPADELFYVSCNPHRLAEELPQLARRYDLLRAQAFDFFPQTHHAEFLLQFRRR
jgi:23S rRNA (uracil1939-C5)-methyltransferase